MRNQLNCMWRPVTVFLLASTLPGLVSAQNRTLQNSDWTQGFMIKCAPLSFGGAYRALADSNAAILYNPAGLAQKKDMVSVGGDYAFSGPTDSHVFSGSIVDSQATDLMVLGLSYDRDHPRIGGIRGTVQQITLSAATDMNRLFFFGGSVKGYLSTIDSPFLSSPDAVDIDVGVLVKPIPMVSLGLTGQNLVQGKTYEEFPLVLGFGGAVALEPHARLAIDVTKNFNTPSTNGVNAYFGAEARLAEGIFLRGGFGLDRIRDNNFYAVGAALIGPKVSLLFTFSQRLNPTDEIYAANIELYF